MGKIMASFNRQKVTDEDITLYTVTGILDFTEVIEELSSFYKSNFTQHMIWDFTESKIINCSEDNMVKIITHAKSHSNKRNKGKTALIPGSPVNFGLLRKYEIISELEYHNIKHAVVNSMDDAIAWLKEGDE